MLKSKIEGHEILSIANILKILKLLLMTKVTDCYVYISNPKDLIAAYDKSNITILPSYTEGYPYVVDAKSLSRKRPVIIFEEISYVVKTYG